GGTVLPLHPKSERPDDERRIALVLGEVLRLVQHPRGGATEPQHRADAVRVVLTILLQEVPHGRSHLCEGDQDYVPRQRLLLQLRRHLSAPSWCGWSSCHGASAAARASLRTAPRPRA